MCVGLMSCVSHVSLSLHSKRGFDVRSFGTGTHVKLPGPAPDKPNIYDFKTTYEQMYNDLVRKDKELYPLIESDAHSASLLALMPTSTKPLFCLYKGKELV